MIMQIELMFLLLFVKCLFVLCFISMIKDTTCSLNLYYMISKILYRHTYFISYSNSTFEKSASSFSDLSTFVN